MVLAFMVPMALAWNQPSTAAITVMLIASSGSVSESLSKGITRVIGTVVGGVVGLMLIALFPQDRLLYLFTLSLILMIIIYLYYAYRGDSTVFMLSAMVIMMIFLHGPENAFLYGIDRVFMTIFGVVIYTLVGVFIWPNNKKKEDKESDFAQLEGLDKNSFIFLDPDNFKATLQLLSVFWMSTLFWIFFNPPGGFLLVILATLLGLFTTFSPLKPTLLMILLSVGFVFATAMYIFVLPNLVYAWQLGVFVFMYTFIAFYFIPPKMSIFFLLGMFLLGINNTMEYNFGLYLNTLLVFYLFLIILMLFHNFPFSTKPEHIFLKNRERYFNYLESLVSTKSNYKIKFYLLHLELILKKMQLWSSKIDVEYFNKISKEELALYVLQCEELLAKTREPIEAKEKESIISSIIQFKETQNIDWNSLKENRF